MSRDIQWGRVLIEGVAIVASILLAFGIEAGWAAEGERRLEREELERVFDELAGERQRIVGAERQQAIRASASLEVVALLKTRGTATATVAIPDSLLALLAGSPAFEAQTPTLDGLLRSGSYSVVSDLEVRSAVARLEERLTSASRQQLGTTQYTMTDLIPALIERGSMSHVLLNSRGAARSQLGGGATQIRADPQIEAIVSYRYIQTVASRDRLAEVGEAMDRLISAISEAISQ